jgi:hypothetical protein
LWLCWQPRRCPRSPLTFVRRCRNPHQRIDLHRRLLIQVVSNPSDCCCYISKKPRMIRQEEVSCFPTRASVFEAWRVSTGFQDKHTGRGLAVDVKLIALGCRGQVSGRLLLRHFQTPSQIRFAFHIRAGHRRGKLPRDGGDERPANVSSGDQGKKRVAALGSR